MSWCCTAVAGVLGDDDTVGAIYTLTFGDRLILQLLTLATWWECWTGCDVTGN